MKELNMLGKPCPIPVVEARRALENENEAAVRVLVDNDVAVENLRKMADGQGYTFTSRAVGENQLAVEITGGKGGAAESGVAAVEAPRAVQEDDKGPVVLVTSDSLGRGSEELGRMLIKGYVFSLTELAPPPKAVIFLNGGANLTCEGANTLDDLRALEEKGVEILTCGTCLNYYTLTEKLAVGSVTDMMGISTRLAAAAARTITL